MGNGVVFSVRDLLVIVAVLGPVAVAGVAFYAKLGRWQAISQTTDDTTAKMLNQLSIQIQSLREEMQSIDRDQRSKIGRLHDRVNVNEAGLAEVKGWREAQKGK